MSKRWAVSRLVFSRLAILVFLVFLVFLWHRSDLADILALNPHDETGGTSLTVRVPAGADLLGDVHLGDSIAINGVCLTVTSFDVAGPDGATFVVGVAPETLRLTNLGSLAAGARVNLERAVRADTRMGGHFVQGHVDTVATVTQTAADGNALTMRFAPRSRAVMRYVVYKGFIALDGTSLTVTAVHDDPASESGGWWEVMLIAYTQSRVALAAKRQGDTVNVEVDMMAKYAEKSMAGYLETVAGGSGVADLVKRTVDEAVAKALKK